MPSPVHTGLSSARSDRTPWEASCHGTISSRPARLYASTASPGRRQSSTPPWPERCTALGTSAPPARLAALPGMVARLLDLAKQLVHVGRVFDQQLLLKHQGLSLAGPVARLAIAAQPLVGVDAHDSEAPAAPAHGGGAHVGDLQL